VACDKGAAGCPATDNRPRHRHICADLNTTGETCATCQICDWWIWFGGPLPAMIRCRGCGRGFNVTERLRASTQPDKSGPVY
jgi:hypothetical protein